MVLVVVVRGPEALTILWLYEVELGASMPNSSRLASDSVDNSLVR